MNIVLSHGPVTEVECIGKDTVIYKLYDGRKFTIRFAIKNGVFYRYVNDKAYDASTFDIFDEDLTIEDYAQWTADNFSEIFEMFEED